MDEARELHVSTILGAAQAVDELCPRCLRATQVRWNVYSVHGTDVGPPIGVLTRCVECDVDGTRRYSDDYLHFDDGEE